MKLIIWQGCKVMVELDLPDLNPTIEGRDVAPIEIDPWARLIKIEGPTAEQTSAVGF